MNHCSLKKTLSAALAALTLAAVPVSAAETAPACAEPPVCAAQIVPDAEAQLDVMAASGVISEELHGLYRSWQLIMRNGHADRSMKHLYAAVTDLDRNGRLELLISTHIINKDPLVAAGEDISETLKKHLTAFCLDNPDRVYGRAYEISADGTKLEPIEIIGDREHFPDFTRIMCKPHKEDGRCVYDLDTGLHPRRDWNSIDPPPYHVVIEKQRLWLTDGKLYYTTEARLEGDVTINGAEERLHADWKVLKFCDTGREVAPFGKEAEEYGRTRNIYGSMIHTVGEDGLSYNTMRASLSALWNNWTPED